MRSQQREPLSCNSEEKLQTQAAHGPPWRDLALLLTTTVLLLFILCVSMPSLGIDLGPTLGAVFLGLAINLVLSGVTLNMCWSYYKQFWGQEKRGYGIIVAIVMCLTWGNSITLFQGCYYYVVYNFDNLLAVLRINPQLASHSVVAGLVVLLVQSVFAAKCYIMSGRKWYIPLPIVVLSLMNMGFSIASTWMMNKQKSFLLFHHYEYVVAGAIFPAAAADLYILSCHVYYLRETLLVRSQDKRSTAYVLRSVLVKTIESNLITTIWALCHVITFLTLNNLVYVTFGFATPRLYEATMLTSLLQRTETRAAMEALPMYSSRGRTSRKPTLSHLEVGDFQSSYFRRDDGDFETLALPPSVISAPSSANLSASSLGGRTSMDGDQVPSRPSTSRSSFSIPFGLKRALTPTQL